MLSLSLQAYLEHIPFTSLFPAQPISRKRLPSLFGEPRWLRARALHPSPVLFADVEPADACQGHVGNCWLIAALSALAEFPSFFKNKIFITKKALLSPVVFVFGTSYVFLMRCSGSAPEFLGEWSAISLAVVFWIKGKHHRHLVICITKR